MKHRKRNVRKQARFFILTITIILLISYIHLPYYVTYPGEAQLLDDIVTVEGGYKDEGDFMLTTIKIGKANLVRYIWAHLNEYQHLYPEKEFRPQWESDEHYHHRQIQMMERSQQSALIVAYRAANKSINIQNDGVVFSGVISGMPAAGKLEVGDVIKQINGQPVHTVEDLLHRLAEKKRGESVELVVERDGHENRMSLTVESFPNTNHANEDNRVGIGISNPATKRSIVIDPPVTFKTGEIGGPSAGLMFALEIYNQLTENDLTKGYLIAGTGEIAEDGRVEAIGGIKQKVVAADKAGADIFFAPVAGGNIEDAKEAAKDIQTDMMIVPVESFHDALAYLETLEKKSN